MSLQEAKKASKGLQEKLLKCDGQSGLLMEAKAEADNLQYLRSDDKQNELMGSFLANCRKEMPSD